MSDRENEGGPLGSGRPKRVIGTPSDVETRYLLEAEDVEERVHPSAEVPSAPPRKTDVSPVAARRAARTVAFYFLLAAAASLAFWVVYALIGPLQTLEDVKWSNRWLGLCMTVAFFAAGVAVIYWVRRLMPHEDVVQEKEPLESSAEEKSAFAEWFQVGAESSGILKYPVLRRSMLLALGLVALSPIVLLRDLGPLPQTHMFKTVWRRGMRLIVEGTGQPIRPEDFAVPGSLLSIVPEGHEEDLEALTQGAVQIIKMRPGELKPPTNLNWTVDGIVAYSKVCTHAGCATGLYEDTAHKILCPCHQSTFDASRGAKVLFGPATRPLPQLPLGLDKDGYLIALGDFSKPVGPNFWEL